MPPKPSAAAWRRVSTGKISSSSHWRANGIISSRAKARAVSTMARCSSVRSKSMSAFRLSKSPRGRVCDRLVVVQGKHAFDGAHQRPDKPPKQHEEADHRQRQDRSDHEIKEADPEGADLKAVMGGEDGVGGTDLDMRDDDADQRGNSRDVGGQIKDIDDQHDLLVGHRRLLWRSGFGD